MTDEQEQGRQPTEEELRAALEEEMRRVTVDDVLLHLQGEVAPEILRNLQPRVR